MSSILRALRSRCVCFPFGPTKRNSMTPMAALIASLPESSSHTLRRLQKDNGVAFEAVSRLFVTERYYLNDYVIAPRLCEKSQFNG